MKNRTIAVGGIVAVLVIAAWWMFVFSGIRSEASDIDEETDAARTEQRSLETQLKLLEDLEANSAETQARLNELRAAVPEQADLAAFIDQANALGAETGVSWVSVTPAPPAATGSVGTVNFSIVVEGGYYQVLDYLNRMENLDRLVVVDGVEIASAEAGGESDATGDLTATLTARMFSQPTAAVGTPTDATVSGGGGIAAPPSGAQEN
jgi:Tfp pilus assembly protein PilO